MNHVRWERGAVLVLVAGLLPRTGLAPVHAQATAEETPGAVAQPPPAGEAFAAEDGGATAAPAREEPPIRAEVEDFRRRWEAPEAPAPGAADLAQLARLLRLFARVEPPPELSADQTRLLWALGRERFAGAAPAPVDEATLRQTYAALRGPLGARLIAQADAAGLRARLSEELAEIVDRALREAELFAPARKRELLAALADPVGPRTLAAEELDRCLAAVQRQLWAPEGGVGINRWVPLSAAERTRLLAVLRTPEQAAAGDAAALALIYAKVAGYGTVAARFAPVDAAASVRGLARLVRDVVARRYQPSTNVLRDEDGLMSEEETAAVLASLDRLEGDGERPRWELALDEALRLAAADNLDLQLADQNRALGALSVLAAEAAFEPLLTSSVGFNTTQSPPSSESTRTRRKSANRAASAGGGSAGGSAASIAAFFAQGDPSSRTSRGTQSSVALRKSWRPGTTTSLSYDVRRTGFQQDPVNYTESFTFNLTQPLLKGFGLSQALYGYENAQLDERRADEDHRAAREATLFAVEQAYWNLAFARAARAVTQQALDNARAQTAVTVKRFEVGAVARLEVKSALAFEARAVSAALAAEAQVHSAQDALLALIRPDLEPAAWRRQVVCTTPPDRQVSEAALAAAAFDRALGEALEHRPDLRRARLALEQAELAVDFRRNQRRPGLDFSGTGGWQGRGENFDHGLRAAYQRHYWNYQVGLSLSVPLGNQAARAAYDEAVARRKIAELSLAKATVGAQVAVRQAVRDLHARVANIKVTTAEEILQEARYASEQMKLREGMSTQVDLDIANKDLAEARKNHYQALIDAALAWATLQREMGRYRPAAAAPGGADEGR